jgi:hypothetical protein
MVSMAKDVGTASWGGNGRGIRFESAATKVRAASVTLTTSAAMPMRLAKTSTLTVIDVRPSWTMFAWKLRPCEAWLQLSVLLV